MGRDGSVPTLGPEWGELVFAQLSWFRQEQLDVRMLWWSGCGALGNEVLKNLTLFGVGHLTVVDFDTVEPSNLTRSVLFRRQMPMRAERKSLSSPKEFGRSTRRQRIAALGRYLSRCRFGLVAADGCSGRMCR